MWKQWSRKLTNPPTNAHLPPEPRRAAFPSSLHPSSFPSAHPSPPAPLQRTLHRGKVDACLRQNAVVSFPDVDAYLASRYDNPRHTPSREDREKTGKWNFLLARYHGAGSAGEWGGARVEWREREARRVGSRGEIRRVRSEGNVVRSRPAVLDTRPVPLLKRSHTAHEIAHSAPPPARFGYPAMHVDMGKYDTGQHQSLASRAGGAASANFRATTQRFKVAAPEGVTDFPEEPRSDFVVATHAMPTPNMRKKDARRDGWMQDKEHEGNPPAYDTPRLFDLSQNFSSIMQRATVPFAQRAQRFPELAQPPPVQARPERAAEAPRARTERPLAQSNGTGYRHANAGDFALRAQPAYQEDRYYDNDDNDGQYDNQGGYEDEQYDDYDDYRAESPRAQEERYMEAA